MKANHTPPKKRNLAVPGEPMTEEEFHQLIKDAEKGPFISMEDFKKEVQEWIRKAEE